MDNMEQNYISHTEEFQTTEPSGKNGSEPKTFTQEDIDRIVQDRLARERKKYQPDEPDPVESREKELKQREMALDIKELLNKEKYPAELANILKYSSVDEFKEQYEALKSLLPNSDAPKIVWPSGVSKGSSLKADPFRSAMKLD